MVSAHARNNDGALWVACLALRYARKFHCSINRLRTTSAKKHTRLGKRRDGLQLGSELVGFLIGERVERRICLERGYLGGDGLCDFGATMANLAVPQAANCVDVLAAIGIPQQRAFAPNNADEIGL